MTSRSFAFDAAWEGDLFGKVRRKVEAIQPGVGVPVEDRHDARVPYFAKAADNYTE